MPRLIFSIVVLSLVLGACAPSSDAGSASTTDPTSPTTADQRSPTTTESPPDPTEGQEDATTTSQPEATDTTSDRPLAPDFTLELGDGGTYTLSEGERPVYLVFWAEW